MQERTTGVKHKMQNRAAQQNKGKRSQLPKNNQPDASKIGEALGQLYVLEKDTAAEGSGVLGGVTEMATAPLPVLLVPEP